MGMRLVRGAVVANPHVDGNSAPESASTTEKLPASDVPCVIEGVSQKRNSTNADPKPNEPEYVLEEVEAT